MKSTRLHLFALLATLVLPAGSAGAATSAKLHVSATILPFVSVRATQHVTTYRVTREDLAKGYLDLPDTLTVTVRTNVASGVPFLVDGMGGATVLVKESGSSVLPGTVFTVRTAGHRAGTVISKRFDSRILLPPDAREGVYSLTLSVVPAT